MKRKLVKQGSATLMLSIPAKWAQLHNLGKGEEVNMEIEEEKLIISSSEIATKNEAAIKLIG